MPKRPAPVDPASEEDPDLGEEVAEAEPEPDEPGLGRSLGGVLESILLGAHTSSGRPRATLARNQERSVAAAASTREKRERKREVRELQRRRTVAIGTSERRLLRTATRGVVKLFNAVAAHQRAAVESGPDEQPPAGTSSEGSLRFTCSCSCP